MIKWRSYIYVGIQFICIWMLFLTTNLHNFQLVPRLISIMGVWLGLWAVYTMRKSVLRVIPEIAEDAILVTDGPYKLIRHPMYSAVLLTTLGFWVTDMSLIRSLIYSILVLDLFVKIQYEESLLMEHFSNYSGYMKRTARLIPFVY